MATQGNSDLSLSKSLKNEPKTNAEQSALPLRQGGNIRKAGGILLLIGLVAVVVGLYSINIGSWGFLALVGWGLIFLGAAFVIPGRTSLQFGGAFLIATVATIGVRFVMVELKVALPHGQVLAQRESQSTLAQTNDLVLTQDSESGFSHSCNGMVDEFSANGVRAGYPPISASNRTAACKCIADAARSNGLATESAADWTSLGNSHTGAMVPCLTKHAYQ